MATETLPEDTTFPKAIFPPVTLHALADPILTLKLSPFSECRIYHYRPFNCHFMAWLWEGELVSLTSGRHHYDLLSGNDLLKLLLRLTMEAPDSDVFEILNQLEQDIICLANWLRVDANAYFKFTPEVLNVQTLDKKDAVILVRFPEQHTMLNKQFESYLNFDESLFKEDDWDKTGRNYKKEICNWFPHLHRKLFG